MTRLLKKILLCTGIIIFCGQALFAQKVTFDTHAPSLVAEGEVFRIEYSIENARPEGFNTPVFEGFEVIAGPSVSEGHNTYISGGNVIQSSSFSYTFVLRAISEGKFSIPSVTVTADGKSYTSRAVPIEVVKAEAAPPPGSQRPGAQQGSAQSAGQQAQAATIANDDILLRVSVSRSNVYRGQPLRVSFKLYTRVPLSGVENSKVPAFNGFWTNELDVSGYKWQRETYNNKIYDARVIREFLLYPQQAGTLQIDPYEITVVGQVVTQSRRQSLLDDFFGGGPKIDDFRKKTASSAVQVTVNELPAGAPEGFNGAVGNFTMTSEVPNGVISANSSATYSIQISGTGNLPLIQAPKIEMPSSFEQYNVKTTESLNTSGSGITGYRNFEYPFIARAEGDYTIEPVLFSYFNPETARYITLSSQELHLQVMPDSSGTRSLAGGGMVSGITKEDLKILGQDIRFIKIGNPGLILKGNYFITSIPYAAALSVLLLLAAALLIYLQRRMREMRNADAVREKRANKVALSRLRAAEQFMKAGNDRKFHDEMLKALWGYMSDKLNIPAANLTKENVREELMKRSIPVEDINGYINLISECEYAQYSPAEAVHIPDLFRNAVNAITKFESYIKK